MAKRNKVLIAVVVVVLLVLLLRSSYGKQLVAKFSGDGYPNSERASAHFSWDELLSASPKVGDTYDTLSDDEVTQFANVARLLEYIRTLNGQLPIVVTFITVPADPTMDTGGTDYSVSVRADAIEKTAGLLQAGLDAQSNLGGYPGSVMRVTQNGNVVQVFGNMSALTDAQNAGALAV